MDEGNGRESTPPMTIDPRDSLRQAMTYYPGKPINRLLRDALAGFEAEIASLKEWRPMETAPKDGTDILLVHDKSIQVGGWGGVSGHSGWIIGEDSSSPETDYLVFFDEPTHWRPLPEPPAIAKAEAGP